MHYTNDSLPIQVQLVGDEFGHYYQDANGNRYQENEDGFLVSVPAAAIQRTQTVAQQQRAVLSHTPVRRANSGQQHGLVILVNFSDKQMIHSQAQFNNMLNQQGYNYNGATGSARDYFLASSNGQYDPVFDVVGPYTLPHNTRYYGSDLNGTGNDMHATDMIVDACRLADADVNFAEYDNDHDSILDNVFVYFAGNNQAEGAPTNTIWPHRYVIYTKEESASNYTYDGTLEDVCFDGIRVYDYACTSELRGRADTSLCNIGTFCHEFSHVLGLPDLYHTQNSDKTTLGYYDIMDCGNYSNNGSTPPLYSAYEAFYVGWLTPFQLKNPAQITLPVRSQDNTPSQACLMAASDHNLNGANPNPAEFFLVEYRPQTGWDAYLPTGGLLIWHIDYNEDLWFNNKPNNYNEDNQLSYDHMHVYLQHTDGANTANQGCAFQTGESYSPILWNNRIALRQRISEIDLQNAQAVFNFNGGATALNDVTNAKQQGIWYTLDGKPLGTQHPWGIPAVQATK